MATAPLRWLTSSGFTPMAVCSSQTWPGPGACTSTGSRRMPSGVPAASMRTLINGFISLLREMGAA